MHVVNYLKEKVKLSEGGGKNAAAKYKEAFECKTMQQLKDFIEQLPPEIKLRFSNMDPATFSPCASTNGAWRGRMGSSFVESGNHALESERSEPPHRLPKKMAQHIVTRYNNNKNDAHACLTTLPPRKAEAMAKVKVEASRIPPSSVTISEDARSALVLSKGKTCKVVFDGIKSCMGCDNGVEMFSGLPCAESVAAVEKKGLCIEEFMHRCDKTSAWRDQYSHPELVMPSSVEVDADEPAPRTMLEPEQARAAVQEVSSVLKKIKGYEVRAKQCTKKLNAHRQHAEDFCRREDRQERKANLS